MLPIPEELELEAELKGDAAIALATESMRLDEAGFPIKARAMWMESERLRDEAEALDERADLMREAYKDDPQRGRMARQQFLASVGLLQKEWQRRGPLNIDNLQEELWQELQSAAKLRIRVAGELAVPDSTGVPGCIWDDADSMMPWESNRPIRHLKNIVSLGNNDLDWVDASKEHPHLLLYYGLSTIGFDLDGTTAVAVANRSAIRVGRPERGLRLLFDVRRMITRLDVIRAQARVLLGNLLSPDQKPALVMSDLNDEWHAMWVDGRTVFHHPFPSRAKAVGFIQAFLAGRMEVCEGSLRQFAQRRKADWKLEPSRTGMTALLEELGAMKAKAPHLSPEEITKLRQENLLSHLSLSVPCSSY